METNKMVLFKDRDFGDQISAVFDFIKLNIGILFKTYLLFSAPFILTGTILYLVGFQSSFDTAMQGEYSSPFSFTTGLGYLLLLTGGMLFSMSGYSIMKLYEQMDDPREMTPVMVWNELTNHLGKYIVTGIVVSILITIAFFLIIIPGIYLLVALSVAMMAVIYENLGASRALDRSLKLVKDNWWGTFAFFLVTGIIYMVITYTIALPITLLTPFNPVTVLTEPAKFQNPDFLSFGNITGMILSNLISYFLKIILIIATGIRYFTLVERKEEISLDAEIKAMTEDLDEE